MALLDMQEVNYSYFMESDLSEFTGKCIAICDNKVISQGKNIQEVVKEAKSIAGNKKFLLARVPDKQDIFY